MNRMQAIVEAFKLEWANFLAKDGDGTWTAFADRPSLDEEYGQYYSYGRCSEIGKDDEDIIELKRSK